MIKYKDNEIYSTKMHNFARKCKKSTKGLHCYLTPFVRIWPTKFGWYIEKFGWYKIKSEYIPEPKILFCPKCNFQHIDRNEWATTRLHKTHLCEKCKHEWRPFEYYTVGVEK